MAKCPVYLGATGLAAGDVAFDFCKKRSDGSNVATAGFTLEDLGVGDYLVGLDVVSDTAFRIKRTAAPEFADFGVLERNWLWQGATDARVIVFLGPGVIGKIAGDMTFDYCKKVSDLSNVVTTGFFWYELGNGYYIVGLSISEDVVFRIHVTAVPEQTDSGVFSPADKDVLAATGNTIRQQLLNALKTRLQTILVTNGYRTDLGLHVEEWDVNPLDPNVDALKVDYADEAGSLGYAAVGEHLHTLPVTLRIRVQANDGTALSTLRKACADVYQAIYADVTFGGLAQDANQEGNISESYGEAADRAAGAEVKYVTEYTTVPGTP